MTPPARGAATSIHLASAPELEQVSGHYFARCWLVRSARRSHDPLVAARLWETNAELAGLAAAPVPELDGPAPTTPAVTGADDSAAADRTGQRSGGGDRVVIVDDHAPFRSMAGQILTADGFVVVGEAADGAAALRVCDELHPDIVMLDVQLPDLDGFAVAALLTARVFPPAVVLMSSRSRADYGSSIKECRACGYLAKAELSGRELRRLLSPANPPPPGR